MRYVENPADIVSHELMTKTGRDAPPQPLRLTFAWWMDQVLGQKSWSDGEARPQLEAQARILIAFESTRGPYKIVDGKRVRGDILVGAEWGIQEEDHEKLMVHAMAYEVEGALAVERPRLQSFKLAIAAASSVSRSKAVNGKTADAMAEAIGKAIHDDSDERDETEARS